MRISLISNNIYTYPTGIQQKNNSHLKSPVHNPFMDNTSATKIPQISFTGAISLSPQRTPFLKSTIKTINEVYAQYEKSLMETSLENIKTAVENIKTNTNYSEKEILSTMIDITQFANMKSADKIGKALTSHEVGIIGNSDSMLTNKYGLNRLAEIPEVSAILDNDKGINGTLDYLLNKKLLHPLDNTAKKRAIFLDDEKIKNLEKLQEKEPKVLEKIISIPDIEYFVLSGFEKGITFLDRAKSLEEKTREILKSGKNSDKPILERIEKLGITPTVISNKQPPTINNVYKNMETLKMSKDELFTLIDANSQETVSGKNNLLVAKDITANYLKENLTVYSPERLSHDLKDFHNKILDYAKTKGKTDKDIIYIIPEKGKSYDYINYSYKRTNNLPDEAFKTREELFYDTNLKHKIIVMLDDCAITGNSIESAQMAHLTPDVVKNADEVLFACVYGTQKAKANITGLYNTRPSKIIFHKETSFKNDMYDKNDLNIIIGNGYRNGTHCVAFPYMSPDNNSALGANIALFHNTNYRLNKNYKNLLNTTIKVYSPNTVLVDNLKNRLNKCSECNYDETAVEKTFVNLNKLSKIEMWEKYKKYSEENAHHAIYDK